MQVPLYLEISPCIAKSRKSKSRKSSHASQVTSPGHRTSFLPLHIIFHDHDTSLMTPSAAFMMPFPPPFPASSLTIYLASHLIYTQNETHLRKPQVMRSHPSLAQSASPPNYAMAKTWSRQLGVGDQTKKPWGRTTENAEVVGRVETRKISIHHMTLARSSAT